MLPSSSDLSYFVEVAATQNISRAAERLGISQPSLSLAIRRLEASVGTPLLIRGKSGVRLTRSGLSLAARARGLLADWERVRSDAGRESTEVGGRYTIGCHPSVGLYSLPGFLPGLLRENPSLEIHLVHDLSRKVTEEVISFRVDFGIVVNPVSHPDLVIRPLAEDDVTLWRGPGRSALQAPGPEGVLICDPDLSQTQDLLGQIRRKGLVFGRTLASSNLEVIAGLAAAGAGVGVLPARVATRVRALGLRKLEPGAPVFHDRICLVYRPDVQKTRAAKVISDAIGSALGRTAG